MSMVKKSAPRFRVGDWVALLYGVHKVRAQIIEDRGPLGVGGRRIYRVLPHVDPRDQGEAEPFEQPEDFLEPATAPG